MERGDIYKVSLDPALGKEQAGARPVLIVSPAAFNKKTGTAIVVPISNGGNYSRAGGFVVSLMGSGSETTGVILCNQLRTLDLKSRNAKKIEKLSDAVMQEVLLRLVTLFEPD